MTLEVSYEGVRWRVNGAPTVEEQQAMFSFARALTPYVGELSWAAIAYSRIKVRLDAEEASRRLDMDIAEGKIPAVPLDGKPST